jgi:hypothetical protein
MAEEKSVEITTRVVVHHNPNTPAPRRITEEQFNRCPSDWLALVKRGQQIIVVDHPDSERPTIVLGVNGVLFQLEDEAEPVSPKHREETENTWLK